MVLAAVAVLEAADSPADLAVEDLAVAVPREAGNFQYAQCKRR